MRDRVPQQSTPSPIQALSVRLMRSRWTSKIILAGGVPAAAIPSTVSAREHYTKTRDRRQRFDDEVVGWEREILQAPAMPTGVASARRQSPACRRSTSDSVRQPTTLVP